MPPRVPSLGGLICCCVLDDPSTHNTISWPLLHLYQLFEVFSGYPNAITQYILNQIYYFVHKTHLSLFSLSQLKLLSLTQLQSPKLQHYPWFLPSPVCLNWLVPRAYCLSSPTFVSTLPFLFPKPLVHVLFNSHTANCTIYFDRILFPPALCLWKVRNVPAVTTRSSLTGVSWTRDQVTSRANDIQVEGHTQMPLVFGPLAFSFFLPEMQMQC